MDYEIRTVDVFSERPFEGNQLAVVLDADRLSDDTMQAIAREMNLSETVFLQRPSVAGCAAAFRIFTPATELPFAGHPTIGAAWVLRETEAGRDARRCEIAVQEKIGVIPIRFEDDSSHSRVWLTQPPIEFGAVREDRESIVAAIGLKVDDLIPGVPIERVSAGIPFLFVAVRDRSRVDAADPRGVATAFAAADPLPVFVFAPDGDARLYSRMFAGHVVGIVEDSATGAAGGPLGAFAVGHGLVKAAHEVALVSEQGTKMRRRGVVHIRLTYANGGTVPLRAEVGGNVVPVITGRVAVADPA